MSSQLWTDDEISWFAGNMPTTWEAKRTFDAMKKVRDDLNARIAELQTLIDNDAVAYITTLTAKEARIAALEAQLGEAKRWEPVIYSTFVEDQSHNDTYLLITLGGTQLEIGTDPTSNGPTVNLPSDLRLCRRAEKGADDERN